MVGSERVEKGVGVWMWWVGLWVGREEKRRGGLCVEVSVGGEVGEWRGGGEGELVVFGDGRLVVVV